MSDIVERLRQLSIYSPTPALRSLGAEAADTIERCYGAIADLQAEVRRKSDEIERLKDELAMRHREIHAINHLIGGDVRTSS